MSISRISIAQRVLAVFGATTLHAAGVPNDQNVLSSTLSSQGIQRLVVPHYKALSDGTHSKLVHRGVNDTYLISSAACRYSLKVYQVNWRSRESIMNELLCIEQLAAHGVSVAAPIPRSDGRTITTIPMPEGLRHAVLFQWVGGVLPSFEDETHSKQVGHHLGRLHTVSDRIRVGRTQSQLGLKHLFQCSVIPIRRHLENKPFQAARFDSLVKQVTGHVRLAATEPADWGFCHGDAAHVNLRVDGEGVHFFDFEWCGPGWRVYDLATYVWSAQYVAHIRNFCWKTLVDSYLEERPQCATSIKFMPLFVVLRHFWHASQLIGLAPRLGTAIISNDFFESFLERCEEIELGPYA